MENLSWGVLGTARIARRKVIPAMLAAPSARFAGLASRVKARAEAGIREAMAEASARGLTAPHPAKAYGSYEALLDDPAIEAVYIPLPNSEHLVWAQRALLAGKHVLIEKPAVLSGAEGQQLLATAKTRQNLLVSEGLMFRHHPQWTHVLRWIHDERIGTLRQLIIQFSFHNDDPQNIRNQPDLGGGALLDLGCYALAASRLIAGAEPQALAAEQVIGKEGMDEQTRVWMRFPQTAGDRGLEVFFSTDIRAGYFQRIDLSGSKGRIAMERPFSPVYSDMVQPRCFDHNGGDISDAEPCSADHFVEQFEAFARDLSDPVARTNQLRDLIRQADLLTAVRDAATRKEWIHLPQKV